MTMPQPDLKDPALVTEVDLARAAAQEVAGDEPVGAHVDTHIDDEAAVTLLFEADKQGYGGWCWAVTIASAGPEFDATVSEVVLLPGPDALVAPEWVPWQERVQAGDLGVGDLMPTDPDDPRLVPAYLASDDPAVEEMALDAGLGRVRVMAREARLDAATRWQHSEFGPRSDMARSAPAHCGTCGFYLPLAGSLQAAFGTCGNEISPADGHVVHTEYGCGAHSEAEVEQVSPVLVADLIYDDAQLDVEPLTEPEEPAAETGATAAPQSDDQPEEAPVAESVTAVEAVQPEAPAVDARPEPTPEEATATEPAGDVESEEAPAAESAVSDAESTPTADTVETVQPEAPAGDAQPDSAPDEVPAAEPAAAEAVEPAGDVEPEEAPATESTPTADAVETVQPEAPASDGQLESAPGEAPAVGSVATEAAEPEPVVAGESAPVAETEPPAEPEPEPEPVVAAEPAAEPESAVDADSSAEGEPSVEVEPAGESIEGAEATAEVESIAVVETEHPTQPPTQPPGG